jgi:hypothetical protein
LRPPVDCPTHRAVIELIDQKTKRQRKVLEAKAEAEKNILEALYTRPQRKKPDNDDRGSLLDKEEIRMMKKEQRLREKLGKQPMPEEYALPKISPIGSLRSKRS